MFPMVVRGSFVMLEVVLVQEPGELTYTCFCLCGQLLTSTFHLQTNTFGKNMCFWQLNTDVHN